MIRKLFQLRYAVAAVAALALGQGAQAQSLTGILDTLYGAGNLTLIGDNSIGTGVGSEGDGGFWIPSPVTGPVSFSVQVKYAGNRSTFGYYDAGSSGAANADANFNSVFTVEDTSVLTSAGAPSNEYLKINSHLSNGISGTADGDTTVATTATVLGSNPTPTAFQVSSTGSPIALGIRTPVGDADSNGVYDLAGTAAFSSSNAQNWDGKRHMLTYGVGVADANGIFSQYVIAWEDLPLPTGGVSDWDYNDLVIEINNVNGFTFAPAPTPEPVTMAMFGAGVVGLAGFRLRQRRAAAAKTTEV